MRITRTDDFTFVTTVCASIRPAARNPLRVTPRPASIEVRATGRTSAPEVQIVVVDEQTGKRTAIKIEVADLEAITAEARRLAGERQEHYAGGGDS